MAESHDQSAVVVIPPDKPRGETPSAENQAGVGQAAPSREIIALPAPLPAQSHPAEPSSAVKPAAAAIDATVEPATRPRQRARAPEPPLRAFAMRDLPPQPKKAWLADIWVKAAALAVATGIGWIAGANTFDRAADVRQLASQLHATDARLAAVAKKAEHPRPAAEPAKVKAELAALKRNIDAVGRGLETQRSALGTVKSGFEAARGELDSVKSGLQAAQSDFALAKNDAAKIERLGQRIDRLEHQVSSSLPTGSIAAGSAAHPAPAATATHPPLPTIKDPHAAALKQPRAELDKARIPPNGYVLREVRDGVAVIEGQNGLREVVPGEMLAGIGRVVAIERHGGRWVVVTSDGLIDSAPY